MTVIYVEHIETCQQGDKSINTRVMYWRWYNRKLFFFINGCANFARTLSTFSVFTHLKTLKLHVVNICYKHTVHGIEIIRLQGNVKLGVFCQLRVFDHYYMEHWIILENVRSCPTVKILKMGFDTPRFECPCAFDYYQK